jgi:hypothetical protein
VFVVGQVGCHPVEQSGDLPREVPGGGSRRLDPGPAREDEPARQPGGGAIALIGTSSMSSPSRSARPTIRAPAMTTASCHQEKPMNSATPTATSTPAVTLSTLLKALRMVR